MSPPVLRGHTATWAHLTRLLDAGRLPHALLFVGPPGIGKSLVAQRLAARLACSGKQPPCGECAGCLQVAAGSHPDLRVVGAPGTGGRKEATRTKKEIGIDQARELKRFVALQAIAAGRKIAIIDDADRLSIAAQNALLKTLEEPPGAAMLILITASPGALLTTVRSRCQRIAFRPLGAADVEAALIEAGVAPDEASRLAARAEGSPGRALSLRARWADDDHGELQTLLAGLAGGRYGSVLAMSKGLGKTDQETVARLDGLLAGCRDDAAAAIAAGDPARLAQAVRRGELCAEALTTLRRRNPNRALLTEALALRLARG